MTDGRGLRVYYTRLMADYCKNMANSIFFLCSAMFLGV